MTICVFSSFTFSYLQRARLLAETTRKAHPDWVFWALIVDKPPREFIYNLDELGFENVMFAHQLGIHNFHSWIFKHDIVEACTAVKGHMLKFLLNCGYSKVVYLDPDIALFHALDEVDENLENYSIILTPHQCEPSSSAQAYVDNESTSFQYGIYNLGFIAVANDEVGNSFASWWSDRLYEACYDLPECGLFTDQKYCDIVPALFSRVYIERSAGYNVASWNLSSRKIVIAGECIYANSDYLRFFHFTKISGIGQIMLERYAGQNSSVTELLYWYQRKIAGLEVYGIPKAYWHYSVYEDGSIIDKEARISFRKKFNLGIQKVNPFIR